VVVVALMQMHQTMDYLAVAVVVVELYLLGLGKRLLGVLELVGKEMLEVLVKVQLTVLAAVVVALDK
jgi:hypothetical protein